MGAHLIALELAGYPVLQSRPMRNLVGTGRNRTFQLQVKTLAKETSMNKYLLKLFITGESLRSSRAITNLRRICEDELGTEYDLVIIDVLERPQLAEDARILATPTLIKEFPLPVRRI